MISDPSPRGGWDWLQEVDIIYTKEQTHTQLDANVMV